MNRGNATQFEVVNMAVQMYMEMGEGIKMPSIGMGTFQCSDESDLETALNAALEIGYRHVDTAFFYQNEHIVGKVIKEWLDAEKLTREELFVTTKLPIFGVHEDLVEEFALKSLENLGLEYIDLYLIHFPVHMNYDEGLDNPKFLKTDHSAVWKKMEAQVDAGRVKAIGLSNFNLEQVDRIFQEARIKPACLQVEIHIYLQQSELVKFCQDNGIVVVAYSPFGSPGFNLFLEAISRPWIGEMYFIFTTVSRGTKYFKLSFRTFRSAKDLPNLFQDTTVLTLADKYEKTPAQILLRFLLQKDIVVIPKSVKPERLQENFNVYDFSISEEDMEDLEALDVGEAARVVDFSVLSLKLTEQPEWPWPRYNKVSE